MLLSVRVTGQSAGTPPSAHGVGWCSLPHCLIDSVTPPSSAHCLVSIESFLFTSCFAFCMHLAKYMENDSRQHMASGFQRRQVNNHPLRFSKINDTTQPRLRPPISTTCSPEVGQGGPPQHLTIPKTTPVFMMNPNHHPSVRHVLKSHQSALQVAKLDHNEVLAEVHIIDIERFNKRYIAEVHIVRHADHRLCRHRSTRRFDTQPGTNGVVSAKPTIVEQWHPIN